ncbi:hypothetical protein BN1708_020196, partial [Verticillium longisporum]
SLHHEAGHLVRRAIPGSGIDPPCRRPAGKKRPRAAGFPRYPPWPAARLQGRVHAAPDSGRQPSGLPRRHPRRDQGFAAHLCGILCAR